MEVGTSRVASDILNCIGPVRFIKIGRDGRTGWWTGLYSSLVAGLISSLDKCGGR